MPPRTGAHPTADDALAFVRREGVVLQAARGRVPSLAEFIAGGPIRGSWWGHPRGHEIFGAAERVIDSGEVLVCRLLDGKVTYVHRALWPALVRLAARFPPGSLAKVSEEHTPSGYHRKHVTPFPEWVPPEVAAAAAALSEADAEHALARWPWLISGDVRRPPMRRRKATRPRS